MLGVSEVIAIILILMITISLAGLAYMFMSTTMSDVTASAGSTVDSTTSSMLTSFTIESMDIAKVYIRNTGQNVLTDLSVYVNDKLATFNVTPSIATGQVGTITIYDFIAEGDTIKVTSPSGFSTSKRAPDPCAKAVGCWKFDEGSGTAAYDSSPYGNDGTLNGPSWTSGKIGNGLGFDGTNDYMSIGYDPSMLPTSSMTISLWVKLNTLKNWNTIIGMNDNWDNGYWVQVNGNGALEVELKSIAQYWDFSTTPRYLTAGDWKYIIITYDSSVGGRIYVDGVLWKSISTLGTIYYGSPSNYLMVGKTGNEYFLNGTLDELRIYNRAIY